MTATAAAPAVERSAAPALHLPPFQLGAAYPLHGGVYAGLVRAPAGQQDWHLFVPTDPASDLDPRKWGGASKNEPGAESLNDGLANTIALCESKHAHPAAQDCRALVIDGFNDLYLPAKGELAICCANVPELFQKTWYWSSTQYAGDPDCAWLTYFDSGYQYDGHKDFSARARPVRRLVIS